MPHKIIIINYINKRMLTHPATISPQRTYLAPQISARAMACVVVMHVCIFAWLFSQATHSMPAPLPALMVRIIAPTALPMAAPVQPKPDRPMVKPKIAPQAVAPRTPSSTLVAQVPASTTHQESVPTVTQPAPAQPAAPSTGSTLPSAGIPAPAFVPARFDAGYLQNPAPVYPSISRRLGEEGRVMLRVFVEPSGLPSQVEIKSGSGSARLDQAAREAVQRWKFIPARQGSDAVAAWVLVPIVFNLRG